MLKSLSRHELIEHNETVFRQQILKQEIETPSYVFDEQQLEDNLELLADIETRTGCKIIHAVKAFASTCCLPHISQKLSGAAASSLCESRLCRDYFDKNMGKDIHVYSPAFKNEEFEELQTLATHIIFNSVSQWEHFKPRRRKDVQYGIRINPEYSEIQTALYNPCTPNSRFGITSDALNQMDIRGLSGIHVHALCEQGSDVLTRVWQHIEAKFGKHLHQFEWINLGGGHFITDADYDIECLVELIAYIQTTYQLEVILEPGAATVLNMGYLVSSVLDIDAARKIAILDTSASAHMPDVIEMPYQPKILGTLNSNDNATSPHYYDLGGLTCLSGDTFGTYYFDQALNIGDQLIFTDMAHYTVVKHTTFNGIQIPTIYLMKTDGTLSKVRQFSYGDYIARLG